MYVCMITSMKSHSGNLLLSGTHTSGGVEICFSLSSALKGREEDSFGLNPSMICAGGAPSRGTTFLHTQHRHH